MSAAMDLLSELRDRGARVWAEGDRLLISPGRVLDPELRERIVAAKGQVLELLRVRSPEFALADRGGAASRTAAETTEEAAPKYGPPLTAEQRRALLDRSLFEMYSPHVPGGICLVATDARALEALGDEPVAVPVFLQAELEQLRDTLRTVRAVFAVELRRVTRTHVDG